MLQRRFRRGALELKTDWRWPQRPPLGWGPTTLTPLGALRTVRRPPRRPPCNSRPAVARGAMLWLLALLFPGWQRTPRPRRPLPPHAALGNPPAWAPIHPRHWHAPPLVAHPAPGRGHSQPPFRAQAWPLPRAPERSPAPLGLHTPALFPRLDPRAPLPQRLGSPSFALPGPPSSATPPPRLWPPPPQRGAAVGSRKAPLAHRW
mmetsp:Transcript_84463/g.257902  ORF Transcript_84463/g.257902 Transcript_84463/m.257902 type:complete len:204 (-) Transcript_84463:236-847(-)